MSERSQKRASTGNGRGAMALGVIVLVAIVAAVVWMSGSEEDTEVASTDEPASDLDAPLEHDHGPTVATRIPPDGGTATTAPTVAREIPDLTGMTIAEQAAAIGDTDLSDGLDLPPPALPTGPPAEIRPPLEADPDFVRGQREAGLHLLDTTIERLESEAAELERAGDAAGAQRARIRVTRSRALRERRAAELEILQQGGTLPRSDPDEAPPGATPPPPPTEAPR